MLDLSEIEITPSLYGIVDRISPIIIMTYWDSCVLPILNDEENEIYNPTVQSIKIAITSDQNRDKGSEVFMVLLSDIWKNNFFNANNVDIKKRFLSEAFNQYWFIAQNSEYWRKEIKSNQLLSYKAAIEQWKQEHRHLIGDCIRNLNAWNVKMNSKNIALLGN